MVDAPLAPRTSAALREALAALGVKAFVLAIHDASFPSAPGEDIGRGSPYSRGADSLVEFAAALGFDGIQLGPQGTTSAGNPSPYDGTLFARSELSIDLASLVRDGLLTNEAFARAVGGRPPGPRVAYRYAFDASREALDAAFAASTTRGPSAALDVDAFRAAHAWWLDRDGLFAALAAEHGDDWARWPPPFAHLFAPRAGEAPLLAERTRALAAARAPLLARHAFAQALVHAQHDELRRRLRARGVRLYGDLQIGISHRDAWSLAPLFLEGYAMGAPPSRTNPAGQAWEYPVLDPTKAAAMDLVRARMQKALAEYDGVRLDHPHGHVDPWVYRTARALGEAELLARVRAGARLFGAPDLDDHPRLAPLAIARAEQLDRHVDRWSDGWVCALDDAQEAAYARTLDVVMNAAARHGGARDGVLCEVLSTQPYPLRRVMDRHGLGRFRVTQKVTLDDPRDVYRSENARPEDWIMVGNHDTPPLSVVVARWLREGTANAHASYLASRLEPDPSRREAFTRAAATDAGALAQAKLAELFVGPAQHVSVFFADLFGMDELYNRPGIVHADNWTLRVPAGFAELWRARTSRGTAFDVPRAAATALRARGLRPDLQRTLTTPDAL